MAGADLVRGDVRGEVRGDVRGEVRGEVRLRDVDDADLERFFAHQLDPDAIRMAAFPARDHGPFLAHWARIRADPTVFTKTIVTDGRVVGNVVSWERSGQRLVGYWLDHNYWGRGIATKALAGFVDLVSMRPLYAQVAVGNAGSIRVLEKCGFRVVPLSSTVDDDGVAEITMVLGGS